MSILSYIESKTGKAGLSKLVEIAAIYGFSFALFDRIEDGEQGLPIDIAEAIASVLSLPLPDLLSVAKVVSPPGPQNRRLRPPRTAALLGSSALVSGQQGQLPLVLSSDAINAVSIKEPRRIPAVRMAPVQQPVISRSGRVLLDVSSNTSFCRFFTVFSSLRGRLAMLGRAIVRNAERNTFLSLRQKEAGLK